MKHVFNVGLTHDFLCDGKLVYRDIGLSVLDAAPEIAYRFFERHEAAVRPEQLSGFDAVISLTPRYTRESLAGAEHLTAIIRFGVGYDSVDVQACTDAGVLLCITAGAVNHSVAEATLAWMLALSHRVLIKDRILRSGEWSKRSNHMGCELRDRTLGVVGLGGIGAKLLELTRGFQMKAPLVFDPFTSAQRAKDLGATLVPLERLLRESDFVSIHCPLTEQTRGLIGRRELALMRDDAFLINTARGGVVDETALIECLTARRIAGAAIDVFESEPVGAGHPLAELENVILAPHSISWTDELFRDIGRMACGAAVELSRGRLPAGIVNREVLERSNFQQKLKSLKGSHVTL
jgi:phosphoglycerate dehydrogenase-like enzyme